MVGFGIALLIFGAIALFIGKSMEGGGGDVFALAFLAPMLIGVGLLIVGALCVLGGYAAGGR